MIGLDTTSCINASGKTGEGINEILQSIIEILPAPKGDEAKPLKALLVDSWYAVSYTHLTLPTILLV